MDMYLHTQTLAWQHNTRKKRQKIERKVSRVQVLMDTATKMFSIKAVYKQKIGQRRPLLWIEGKSQGSTTRGERKIEITKEYSREENDGTLLEFSNEIVDTCDQGPQFKGA